MTESTLQGCRKTDWLLIGVLLALVLPLRVWLICNTEVTSRDSIGYIRYALQFEKYDWPEVLRKNQQHPGYPALVWLMSVPVRAMDGATTPENMELAAQLVNLLASALLILPTYWLGRQFFDRPVAFVGTLLYQYLPTSAQHLSDGISEPIFLLVMVTALLQGVHAVCERSIWRCGLCGLLTGVAYLTRPEGALVLPALGLVMIGSQCRSTSRMPWPRFLACGAAAVLTAALIGSIYVCATGRITNKPSASDIGTRVFDVILRMIHFPSQPAGDVHAQVGGHLFAAMFTKVDSKSVMFARSIWALVSEINQGFHYVAGVPALIGFLWAIGRLRHDPGFWVLLTFAGLHSVVLIALATSQGYVSDRHVMILVLGGCFFAAFALWELPRRILLRIPANDGAGVAWHRSATVWSSVLVVAFIGFCLPKAAQRLHGNRVANHQAGLWLAGQLEIGDHIEDDHSWSHFFTGRLFSEGDNPEIPTGRVPICYVVLTKSRDPLIDAQRLVDLGIGREDPVWPSRDDLAKARVVIYAQPRSWEKQPWKKARSDAGVHVPSVGIAAR